jgi:hypothetical protein
VIDSFFDNKTFNFAFVNTLFAADNYKQPLQPFIDDQLFFPIDP